MSMHTLNGVAVIMKVEKEVDVVALEMVGGGWAGLGGQRLPCHMAVLGTSTPGWPQRQPNNTIVPSTQTLQLCCQLQTDYLLHVPIPWTKIVPSALSITLRRPPRGACLHQPHSRNKGRRQH